VAWPEKGHKNALNYRNWCVNVPGQRCRTFANELEHYPLPLLLKYKKKRLNYTINLKGSKINLKDQIMHLAE